MNPIYELPTKVLEYLLDEATIKAKALEAELVDVNKAIQALKTELQRRRQREKNSVT